jgi:formylglycine-generating enzyme required for sulfatase activity
VPDQYTHTLLLALTVICGGLAGPASADQYPGVYVDTDDFVPEMVAIPGGCIQVGSLLMGSEDNPPREVCLDNFYLSRYEIRYAEFEHFMAERASPGALTSVLFKNSGNLAGYPVTDVSWFDAMEYAAWLSRKTGRTFRLPTEEEWEYAARAGAGFGAQYSWGNMPDPDAAHCRDCSSGKDTDGPLHSGQFAPNAFGIYDMHGNVAEWTIGCFHPHDEIVERVRYGQRVANCRTGVVRGGSYLSRQQNIAFWTRLGRESTRPAPEVGFRLLME